MIAKEGHVRAFVAQFDRASLGVALLGAAIGLVWLVALDLGIAIAGITLLVGSIALIVHHRWIEIGLLMIGIGLVVAVGYAVLGPPPIPPQVIDPLNPPASLPIVAEVFAPGMAALILSGGLILTVAIGAWDVWEGRRRQRLDERHRQRRARQIADS